MLYLVTIIVVAYFAPTEEWVCVWFGYFIINFLLFFFFFFIAESPGGIVAGWPLATGAIHLCSMWFGWVFDKSFIFSLQTIMYQVKLYQYEYQCFSRLPNNSEYSNGVRGLTGESSMHPSTNLTVKDRHGFISPNYEKKRKRRKKTNIPTPDWTCRRFNMTVSTLFENTMKGWTHRDY